MAVGSAGQVDVDVLKGGQRFERAALVSPLEEIAGCDEYLLQVLSVVSFPNHEQALWIAKGQRLEKHGIHHAEDGAGRAHAEGQGQQGDGAESRSLPQQARPVAQIPGKGVHGLSG